MIEKDSKAKNKNGFLNQKSLRMWNFADWDLMENVKPIVVGTLSFNVKISQK